MSEELIIRPAHPLATPQPEPPKVEVREVEKIIYQGVYGRGIGVLFGIGIGIIGTLATLKYYGVL